ncbi:F-box domain protein [Pandoravirus inopinatum]|uniref:F-box domain protein n=1 Tax=Pandoravirus inopinatum TaxID=1605721 RepID=A0A0B5IX38_9VIRU|nr:F-box domain protein [Pandoravirus inopinatum]AJF97288.1 F-box domain protein [Pandoravirus inopinatum]
MDNGFGSCSDHADVLPPELWDRILNGVDRRGRPLLDPRFRCMARMTCSRWRAVTSATSKADRVRIASTVSRGRDFCGHKPETGKPTDRVVYASAVADIFARSGQAPDLALSTVCRALRPDNPRDHAITLAAMAASGVGDYFQHVLALVAGDAPCVDPTHVGCTGRASCVDGGRLRRAIYIACLHRGCVYEEGQVEALVTELELLMCVGDIIRADRPHSLGAVLVHLGCRCASHDPTSLHNDVRPRETAMGVWDALANWGTLSTTRVVLAIQRGTSFFDVGAVLRRYLVGVWRYGHWVKEVVRCGRREVIEAHDGSAGMHMAEALREAINMDRLSMAQWLAAHHRQHGGTGICGMAPEKVRTLLADCMGGKSTAWWRWLVAYGCDPTDDDARPILARSWCRDADALDFIDLRTRQSALTDGGKHVVDLLCADPPRLAWSVRERTMRTLAPHMPVGSAPVSNGLWQQAMVQVTERIVKAHPRASDVSASLLWLCRKAHRWGLLDDALALSAICAGVTADDLDHPRALLAHVPSEPEVWSVWVGKVTPLPVPVVAVARTFCGPPTDREVVATISGLLRLLDEAGLVSLLP